MLLRFIRQFIADRYCSIKAMFGITWKIATTTDYVDIDECQFQIVSELHCHV